MPLGGLGEGTASSEQQQGTYQHGVNVRSRDPETGQRRPAAREGLILVGRGPVDAAGEAVTSIHRVGEHSPTSTWVELDTDENPQAVPTEVVEHSITDLPERAVAIEVASNGDRFILLADGSIAIVNEDEVVVDTIYAPAPGGFDLVPRIQIDDAGGIVVAWRVSATRENIAGIVYRLQRSLEETWETHFNLRFFGTIVDFVAQSGELYVAQHRPDDVTEGPLAYVSRISSALTGPGTEVWARVVAYPIGGIDSRDDGALCVASEPNPTRAQGGSAAPTEPDWNPRRPVEGVYDPDTELMWWTSATRLLQSSPGNPQLANWESELEDPSPYSTPVHTGARGFTTDTARDPVQLITDTGNGHPGIRFSTLAASRMFTAAAVSTRAKDVPEDDAGWHRIPIPGMRSPGDPGHAFCVTVHFSPLFFTATPLHQTVIRLGEDRFKLSVKWLPGGSWEFGFVADYDSALPAAWGDNGAGRADFFHVVAGDEQDTPYIVTLVYNGAGVAGSSIRVNGTAIWTGTFDKQFAELNEGVEIGYDSSQGTDRFGGEIMEVLGTFGRSDVLPHDTPVALDIIERNEAWIAYTYEIEDVLPLGHAYVENPPGVTGGVGPTSSNSLGLDNPNGLLVKFDLSGNARWIGTGSQYGSAVTFGLEDDIFTAGFQGAQGPGTFNASSVAMVVDEGDELRETGNGTWIHSGFASERWQKPLRLMHDGCGGVVVPRYTLFSTTGHKRLDYFRRDGTERFRYFTPNDRILATVPQGAIVDASATGGPCGPERLGAIYRDEPFARQLTVLGRIRTGATSSRRISTFATASSGKLSRIEVKDGAEWGTALPAGLNGNRPWALTVYPLTMFGDGDSSYYVYDARNQTVRLYAGTSRGTLPRRCEFGISYRARAVLGGGDDRSEIAYSALGDITDWDSDPELITAEQAVAQAQARARKFPDLVRGLLAWSDDLMIVFCDGSVWRQTGDPMLGGQSDQVVRDVGLADTWAHTIDPRGAIYFLATNGHIYRMGPDGRKDSIVEGKVHRRFLDIDLRRYRVELQWDPVMDGLWTVLIPRGAPETNVEHYFWDRAFNAWHPVQFAGGVNRCVTAIGMRDGDGPQDAGVLFGFADGSVRASSRFATDDDGIPIRWQLLVGPIFSRIEQNDVKMGAVEIVLSQGSRPAFVGGYASPVADVLGKAQGVRRVEAGRGLRVPVRVRGSSLWIGIAGEGPCAIEELSAQFARGGVKQRTHKRVS